MTHNHLIRLGAYLALAGCLAGAAVLVDPIRRGAVRQVLAAPEKTPDAAAQLSGQLPAWVGLAIAMGGPVRAVAIHYLWYQRATLKEEGRHYAAATYSRLLVALQPNSPADVYFHAWDMAYNISVMCNTPQERWDWVTKGINLVRDKGIPYHPRAVSLYKELAWIFIHKMGGLTDDMHWYYKYHFALEWQQVLGAPTPGATAAQAAEEFRPVAEAPDSLEELVRRTPAAQPVLQRFREYGWDLDADLLRALGHARTLRASLDAKVIGLDVAHAFQNQEFGPKAAALLGDPQLAPGVDAVLFYLRKRVLREHYHMDPAFMLTLMLSKEQGGYGLGPLDWRHPIAHGAYWAALGVKIAAQTTKQNPLEVLNTDREVIMAMQNLTELGRMTFDPVGGASRFAMDLGPDPRFIPAYETALEDAVAHVKQANPDDPALAETYAIGHENFLLKAVVYHYLYGDLKEADRYRRKARELYGQRGRNPVSRRYDKSLEDLFIAEFLDIHDTFAARVAAVNIWVERAFVEGLATGRRDIYEQFLKLARAGHKVITDFAADRRNPLSPQDRMGLRPYDETVANVYAASLTHASRPLPVRWRLWQNSPLELRQRAYDQVRPLLAAECQRTGADFARAFPEPPGMAEYRKAHPAATQPDGAGKPVRLEAN